MLQTYYAVYRRRSHGIHKVDEQLEDEDDDEEGRHFDGPGWGWDYELWELASRRSRACAFVNWRVYYALYLVSQPRVNSWQNDITWLEG